MRSSAAILLLDALPYNFTVPFTELVNEAECLSGLLRPCTWKSLIALRL